MGEVERFPIERVMSSRVAEEKIGSMKNYKYPAGKGDEWVQRWLLRRNVLLGWEPVKKGIVSNFKGGRVRHIISATRNVSSKKKGRPVIEVFCKVDMYPIFNWNASSKVSSVPAVLLSAEQFKYFRLCKNCEAQLKRMLEEENALIGG